MSQIEEPTLHDMLEPTYADMDRIGACIEHMGVGTDHANVEQQQSSYLEALLDAIRHRIRNTTRC